MKLVATIAAALLASTAAHAYTITISDDLLADNHIFDTCVGASSCSTSIGMFDMIGQSQIIAGGVSVVGQYLAPSPSGAYAAADSSGVTFHATPGDTYTSIEFNWGSVDPGTSWDTGMNWFAAGSTLINGAAIEPFVTALNTQRDVSVSITGLTPFDVATWSNYPATKFEFNSVGIPGNAAATPELSTWAMFAIGVAGISFAGYRRKAVTPRLATIG